MTSYGATLSYLTAVLLISTAAADSCHYVFDNSPYEMYEVLNIKGLPTNLAYNPNTKDLFFTLIDIDSLQNEEQQTKMIQYVLRDGEAIKIDDVNGQAAAISLKSNLVYLASDNGLHVITNDSIIKFLGLESHDIVQLVMPHDGYDLYVVLHPENDVYKMDIETKEMFKVEAVPCAFILAVDSQDNMYFECDSKNVKVLLSDFEEPIKFSGIGKNVARAITTDMSDRVVLAANDGLYHLRPDNIIPKKLMNLKFIPSGIVFADDDFFLATAGTIYLFSNDNCRKNSRNRA